MYWTAIARSMVMLSLTVQQEGYFCGESTTMRQMLF